MRLPDFAIQRRRDLRHPGGDLLGRPAQSERDLGFAQALVSRSYTVLQVRTQEEGWPEAAARPATTAYVLPPASWRATPRTEALADESGSGVPPRTGSRRRRR